MYPIYLLQAGKEGTQYLIQVANPSLRSRVRLPAALASSCTGGQLKSPPRRVPRENTPQAPIMFFSSLSLNLFEWTDRLAFLRSPFLTRALPPQLLGSKLAASSPSQRDRLATFVETLAHCEGQREALRAAGPLAALLDRAPLGPAAEGKGAKGSKRAFDASLGCKFLPRYESTPQRMIHSQAGVPYLSRLL